MKAYRVVISEACRKQNRPLHTFDIQSEASQKDVTSYYYKKYEGFIVTVDELLILELPAGEVPLGVAPKVDKINFIKIEQLDLVEEETRQLGLIADRQRNLSRAKEQLSEIIKTRILESNKLLYRGCGVNIKLKGDWPQMDYRGDCTVSAEIYLNGNLEESINENRG